MKFNLDDKTISKTIFVENAFEYQNVLYIANCCHMIMFWEHMSTLCNK